MSGDTAWSTLAGAPVKKIPLWYVDAPDDSDQASRIIRAAGELHNVSFDVRDAAIADRILRIDFHTDRVEESLASSLGRTFSSIMTLTVISSCAPGILVLDAEVVSPDGTILRQYLLSERFRVAIADNCRLPPNVLETKKAGKLVRTLLQQIAKDKEIWPATA
jgi:hypothetical protein